MAFDRSSKVFGFRAILGSRSGLTKRASCPLLDLPHEILLLIGTLVSSADDLSCLARTNRRLHAILSPFLIQRFQDVAVSWADRVLAHQRASGRMYSSLRGRPLGKAVVRLGGRRYGERFLSWKHSDLADTGSVKNMPGTVLKSAISQQREDIVDFLLPRMKTIDFNPESNFTEPPVHLAVSSGHSRILGLLLSRADVDPNIKGRCCGSFCRASSHPDPSKPTGHWASPLHHAVRRGRYEPFRLLLERSDINASLVDEFGQTPLFRAALSAQPDFMRLLLARCDVDVEHRDAAGRTPLLFATQNRVWSSVKVLLERPDVNPDAKDEKGQTPLFFAAMYGGTAAVTVLLRRKEVDPTSETVSGETPISIAKCGCSNAIVAMLQARTLDDFSETSSSLAESLVSTGIMKNRALESCDYAP